MTFSPNNGLNKDVLNSIFTNPTSITDATVTIKTESYDSTKPTTFIVSAKDCSACTPTRIDTMINNVKNNGHNVVLLKEESYQGGYSSLYKNLQKIDKKGSFPRTITI